MQALYPAGQLHGRTFTGAKRSTLPGGGKNTTVKSD
jgi:hypothetical protein